MTPTPPSAAPVQKVVAGALAGALSTIVVYVLDNFVLQSGKMITGEVAAAITVVFTFVVSYMVPPAGTGAAAPTPAPAPPTLDMNQLASAITKAVAAGMQAPPTGALGAALQQAPLQAQTATSVKPLGIQPLEPK